MSASRDVHQLGAAFAAAAIEAGAVGEAAASLKALGEALATHPEQLSALAETVVPVEKRIAAAREALADIHPFALNLFCLLIEQDAVQDFEAAKDAAFARLAELKAYHEVTVVSATKLAAADHKAISDMLQTELGGEIEMTEKTDPSLLAGIMVEHGGTRLDASVRGRLNRLTHHLYGS